MVSCGRRRRAVHRIDSEPSTALSGAPCIRSRCKAMSQSGSLSRRDYVDRETAPRKGLEFVAIGSELQRPPAIGLGTTERAARAVFPNGSRAQTGRDYPNGPRLRGRISALSPFPFTYWSLLARWPDPLLCSPANGPICR